MTEILKCLKVKCSESAEKSLELSLRNVCNNLHTKWVRSSYNETKFKKRNETRLMQNYTFPEVFLSEICRKNVSHNIGSNLDEVNFNNYSDKRKNRLTESLRSKYSIYELINLN